ncbi:hypothetical protein HHI36_003186 [Cryptolaemus montrouzieri]|uniref:Gustatory receptor n=1 Tax=Cryptolaemus montrouzieri TaxID=559131 RepID=A0ABD2PCQ5_9CUCU
MESNNSPIISTVIEFSGLLLGLIKVRENLLRNVLWNISLLIYAVYLGVWAYYYVYSNHNSEKTADYEGVFKYATQFCRMVELAQVTFRITWYRIKAKPMKMLLDEMEKRKMGIRSFITIENFHFVPIFSIFIGVIILEHIYFYHFENKELYTLMWVYPLMLMILEYFVIDEIIRHIRKKFRTLNNELIILTESWILYDIYPGIKNQVLAEFFVRNVNEEINRIHKLSTFHYDMMVHTQVLSQFFTVLFSGNMATMLCGIIDACYNISHLPYNMNHWKPIFRSSSWVILQAYCAALIVNAWESLKSEANKSASILHDIWNKHSVENGTNRKMNYLRLVALRFSATKLNFTAHGLFPINRALLHSMLTTVTTYVLILVQLKDVK